LKLAIWHVIVHVIAPASDCIILSIMGAYIRQQLKLLSDTLAEGRASSLGVDTSHGRNRG